MRIWPYEGAVVYGRSFNIIYGEEKKHWEPRSTPCNNVKFGAFWVTWSGLTHTHTHKRNCFHAAHAYIAELIATGYSGSQKFTCVQKGIRQILARTSLANYLGCNLCLRKSVCWLSEAGWISQGKITEFIAQAFALPQTTFANHYQNGQNGLGGFMIYPGKAVLRPVCSTPFLPKKELQPDIVF